MYDGKLNPEDALTKRNLTVYTILNQIMKHGSIDVKVLDDPRRCSSDK